MLKYSRRRNNSPTHRPSLLKTEATIATLSILYKSMTLSMCNNNNVTLYYLFDHLDGESRLAGVVSTL